MSEDLKVEYILLNIREKLNKDKVKLWLPPYILDDENCNFDELDKLANEYSLDLKIDKNVCIASLKELQNHALDKLKEKEAYNKTGVALIKVKLSGVETLLAFQNNDNKGTSTGNTVSKILTIHIKLSAYTSELRKAVATRIRVAQERVKLISSGKVLVNDFTLDYQGLKHGVQIMAVILNTDLTELKEFEEQQETLRTMKDDVNLLASKDSYFQITDQAGKNLKLPAEEKRALVTAMALHEKGRAALKKDEHALALVFLLEADKEFSSCNSQLLNSVDNYGLLNLDIAWCYLCLKNVTQLPDAEKRLKLCESKFNFSYGPNLERLVALKGNSGNEGALLMRLHLLQGIVLFHQNKYDEAKTILKEAKKELSALKVDDTSLSSLMELGMTAAEARIALRATRGCVNSAVEYINRRRIETENIKAKEKEERKNKKFGKCADKKQFVRPELVTNLESMGFAQNLAVEALRLSNNEINEAINLIQSQPQVLESNSVKNFDLTHFEDLIQQLSSWGYDPEVVKRVLKSNKGNIDRAMEDLVRNQGIHSIFDNIGGTLNSLPSTSTGNALKQAWDKINQLKKEQEAFQRFTKGINSNLDDHLDMTLEREEQFLMEYLSLL